MRERIALRPASVSVRFGCVFVGSVFRFSVLCFGLNILEILVSTRQQRRGRGSGRAACNAFVCVCECACVI